MRSRYRLALLFALALGPASCRGCGWREGEKSYEKLDAKYDVVLVRKTHWTGGRIGGPVSDFFVRVETTPPIDEPVYNCTKVDMAEDEAGNLVAFRCRERSDKSWTVLRLRGGDRRLRECNAPVGTSDTPDWSRLEPVRASTSRIFDCDHTDDAHAMREITRAVAEDEGPAVAGAHAGTTLAALGSGIAPDPWEAARTALDPAGQTAALAKLCAELARTDGRSPAVAYVRAARHCPLDGTGALAMLRTVLADHAHDKGAAYVDALFWSGLLAARANPGETGDVLCKAVSDEPGAYDGERKTIIAELLGHTKTKCDAVSAWLATPPCTFNLDCDGGICPDEELARHLEGWDAELDAGVRADPTVSAPERGLLRAAHARGPLPREIVLPNQRRRYEQADASDHPYCNDLKHLEAGAPCNCRIGPLTVCFVKPADHTFEETNCTISIDDAHRRFGTPQYVCGTEGGKCYPHDCCAGLQCMTGICRTPAPPDASRE